MDRLKERLNTRLEISDDSFGVNLVKLVEKHVLVRLQKSVTKTPLSILAYSRV